MGCPVFAARVPSCTCPTYSEHYRFTALLRFLPEECLGPLAFKYQALSSLGSQGASPYQERTLIKEQGKRQILLLFMQVFL